MKQNRSSVPGKSFTVIMPEAKLILCFLVQGWFYLQVSYCLVSEIIRIVNFWLQVSCKMKLVEGDFSGIKVKNKRLIYALVIMCF